MQARCKGVKWSRSPLDTRKLLPASTPSRCPKTSLPKRRDFASARIQDTPAPTLSVLRREDLVRKAKTVKIQGRRELIHLSKSWEHTPK